MIKPTFSNTSLLNQSNISLERAKKNLTGLKTVINSKQVSPFRPMPSIKTINFMNSNSYKSIPINNKNNNQIGLVSPINNEIINNNKTLTGNNVKLSNKLNALIGVQNNNQININQKINELVIYCDYLEEQLKNYNDINSKLLNSYEELNIKVKETIINNNKIENEIKNFEEGNIDILKSNNELKRNLNDINKKYEDNFKNLKDYYSNCSQNFNDSMERFSFLNNLNNNLQKSKIDYNELINKMKETMNILSNKKNSQSLDLKHIEKNLNDKDEELKKRDEQLKELKLINEHLIQEGNLIQQEINEAYDELTNHQQLGNQLMTIKDILNSYDSKIEELKEIIRKKDNEIEDIKNNYNDLNKKLKRNKNENSNNDNIDNYKYNIYKRNLVKIPFNYYSKTNSNFNLNNVNKENKKEISKIQLNNNLNINNKKNKSQILLEENRKLQQDYLNLIGQSINLKKMDKKYENNSIWNNLNNNFENKNKENDENLNQINKIIYIDNKLNPIEEEQKEELNSELNPIENLPLQMIRNEENKNNFNQIDNIETIDMDI